MKLNHPFYGRQLICAALFLIFFLGASAGDSVAKDPVTTLVPYPVDTDQISVSGISSGGYMAVQMHVAHSRRIMGAGVFAAGPYYCAEGSAFFALWKCMDTYFGPPDLTALFEETDMSAKAGLIDPIRYLKGDRVFLFTGAKDSVVEPQVVNSTEAYYEHYARAEDIKLVTLNNAEHTFPTNDNKQNPCAKLGEPFVGYCHYDGAGEMLKHIYTSDGRALTPPKKATGLMARFSQQQFREKCSSLLDFGFIYVPSGVLRGETAKLHIVFHGCKQSTEYDPEGDFFKHAGYNEWAEANNIIILYPQVRDIMFYNPSGCWDWWGYEGPDYYTKNGRQITAVMEMITILTGKPM